MRTHFVPAILRLLAIAATVVCGSPPLPAIAQSVSGRVLDIAGSPVVGATVVAADSSSREIYRSTTDESGRFLMRFPAGTVAVALGADAEGYRPTVSERVSFTDGADRAVTLTLAPRVPDDARRVAGWVREPGGIQPVRDALVSLTLPSGLVVSGVTDVHGRFVLDLVPDNALATLTVTALGYLSPPPTRVFLSAEGAFLEVEIPVDPVQLEGFEVTVRARRSKYDVVGMTERASRAKLGRFLFEEDLEPLVRVAAGRTAELFRRVPGMTVSGGIPTFIRAGCPPVVWVDGSLSWRAGPSWGSFRDAVPPPEFIGAVEIYRPFSMPAQFGGLESHCGALVIWTKGG